MNEIGRILKVGNKNSKKRKKKWRNRTRIHSLFPSGNWKKYTNKKFTINYKILKGFENTGTILSCCKIHDNLIALGTLSNRCLLFDLESGKITEFSLKNPVSKVRSIIGTTKITFCDWGGCLHFLDWKEKKMLHTLEEVCNTSSSSVWECVVIPYIQCVAVGGKHVITLVDYNDFTINKSFSLNNRNRKVFSMLSLRNNDLCIGDDVGCVSIWNIITMKEICSLYNKDIHNRTIWSILQINDEVIVLGSFDERISIWNIKKQICYNVFNAFCGYVRHLSFLGGCNLIFAGSNEKEIKIFEIDVKNQWKEKELCSIIDIHSSYVTQAIHFNDLLTISVDGSGKVIAWKLNVFSHLIKDISKVNKFFKSLVQKMNLNIYSNVIIKCKKK